MGGFGPRVRLIVEEAEILSPKGSLFCAGNVHILESKTSLKARDLVRDAGVDVTDWANVKGGKSRATSNPKYCYEWAFVEPGKLLVLSLWHDSMEVTDGQIVQKINPRAFAEKQAKIPKRGVVASRSRRMDEAMQLAFQHSLPIRVLVCSRTRRNPSNPNSDASKVERRKLDPVAWAITKYDLATGECTLTRGEEPIRYVDQFDLREEESGTPERRKTSGESFVRNPEVRRLALQRAGGSCEWCREPGFPMPDGRRYLETHHVVPLSDGGTDSVRNVVAVCANHHREAHHGTSRDHMRDELLQRAGKWDAEQIAAGDVSGYGSSEEGLKGGHPEDREPHFRQVRVSS